MNIELKVPDIGDLATSRHRGAGEGRRHGRQRAVTGHASNPTRHDGVPAEAAGAIRSCASAWRQGVARHCRCRDRGWALRLPPRPQLPPPRHPLARRSACTGTGTAGAYAGKADVECEMLVLGAGPGGYSAAFRAADLA